jgi:predicted acylesterase/phospholipase RssA
MEQVILTEKLCLQRPDIYIRPGILAVKALDFLKVEAVYSQAAHAREELKRQLGDLMAR